MSENNKLEEQIREMEAKENIPNIDLKKAKSDFFNYTEKQRKYEEIVALKPSSSMNCRNKTDAIDSLKESAENGHPEAMVIFAKKVLNDEILVKFKSKNKIIKETSFDVDGSLDFGDRRIFSLDNTTGKTKNSNDTKKYIVNNFLEPLVVKKKLEENNPEALFICYNIFDRGLYGFDSDKKKALDFLKMSGTLKHSEALTELNNYTKKLFPELYLGKKFFSETNKNFEKKPIEETIEIFKILAKAGDKDGVDALYNIGALIYGKKLNNDGTVLFSNDKLMEILKFLIDLGHEESMYIYGRTIFLGDHDQQKNVVSGFEFIKNAAEKNYPQAQLACGHILFYGKFSEIKKNVKLGLEFLEKSANNGNAEAMFELANIFYNVDINRFIYYIDKAASKGYKKAIETKKNIENERLRNKNYNKQILFAELMAKSSEFCDREIEYYNSGLENKKIEEYLKQLQCEAINLLDKLDKSDLIENLDDKKNVAKAIALIEYPYLIYTAVYKSFPEGEHCVLFDELIKKNKIYLDNDILNLIVEKAKSYCELLTLYRSIVILHSKDVKSIYIINIKQDEEKLLEVCDFYLSNTNEEFELERKNLNKYRFDEEIIRMLNDKKSKTGCPVEKFFRISNMINNYRKRKLANATAKFEEGKEHSLI